jgi:biopolymer transport protein ExbD
MRLPNLRQNASFEFNMTPMIDVVFLLIIFFLVSSHLAKQESQKDLPLPTADSGEKQETATRRLTLNVLRDGELTLAGRQVQRHDLQARLLDAREQEPGELEVRIRSDREVPYGQIAPILRSCVRAGIWDVKFGVFRPEDVR